MLDRDKVALELKINMETIKLGLMAPLSGLVGIYGPEIVHAAQVACEEVNKSGEVLGKKLELIIEDDGSLPDSSLVAAKKLVNEHQCVAMIGNLLSNSRIAVAYQVAEPNKIPYLNFSFYEGSILSRYFFHFAALPNQQIDKMIPYMAKKYGARMFFAGNNYEWPRGSIFAAKQVLLNINGESIGEEYLPIGVSLEEINKLLDKVEQANPNVFVPYFAGNDQKLLLEQFTKRGLKKKIAVVMGHFDEMLASHLRPEVRDGFYSSNSYFMSIKSPYNDRYKSLLAQHPEVNGIWPQGNGITTNFGEGAYICVKAFAKAVNQADNTDPDSLITMLKDITVSAPQGPVKMQSKHQHASINNYLTRCNAAGEFEIVRSFGLIAPELPSRYKHQDIGSQANLEDDIRLQSRILEQMSEGVVLVSADSNKVVYYNTSAKKTFQYGDDFESDFYIKESKRYHSSVYETYPQFLSKLRRKGEHKSIISSETVHGTQIFCSLSASTFTHPVYLEVWLIVIADVTEQVKAEEELTAYRASLESQVDKRTQSLKETERKAKNLALRLQKIMDTAGEGIITTNEFGVIEFLNPAAENLFGYTQVELLGQNVKTLVADNHQIEHGNYIEIFNAGASSKIMTTGREVKGYRKNGEIIDVSISVSNMKIDGVKTFTAICHDITHKKRDEEELRRAMLLAENANNAKSEFLSSMSHELRTPLNAIMGFSQLLQMNALSHEQRDQVKDIYSAGEHLLGLINDILDLAKIEAGQLNLSIEPVLTRDLLDECLKFIKSIAEKNSITIYDRTSEMLPNIQTDHLRGKQVILNLISNAIKYNSVQGSVCLTSEVLADNFLRIKVTDTGAGIAKDKQTSMFQPFNRLGAESSAIEGTGIGLSLTKNLIEGMGGRIGFISSEVKGSSFWLDFPLSEQKSNASLDEVKDQFNEIKNLSGHVIYIEDNITNLKLIQSLFKNNTDIILTSAKSAEEGLKLIEKNIPDVVLMDINLPGMSGIEALKLLKRDKTTKHIPIIAISANAMPEIVNKGKEEGFIHYLTKPIDLKKLCLILSRQLNNIA